MIHLVYFSTPHPAGHGEDHMEKVKIDITLSAGSAITITIGKETTKLHIAGESKYLENVQLEHGQIISLLLNEIGRKTK